MPKPATQNIISALAEFDIVMPSRVNLTGFNGNLHNDSRLIVEGDIFCAIIGHQQDGRQYIEQAINQGAKLVITECESAAEHGELVIATSEKYVTMV